MKNNLKLKMGTFTLFLFMVLNSISVVFIVSAEQENQILDKVYCSATIEDDFSDDEVIIVLMPSFNFVEYTVNDFTHVGCISLEELTLDVIPEKLCRILQLTLLEHSKENVLNVITQLEQREDIYSAEPNYYVYSHVEPTDPIYINGSQWAIDKISLPEAWDINTGSNTITVGIIDGGIDGSHPDLENCIDRDLSKCFSDDCDDALFDSTGHGTYIAGVIAAQSNNSLGITGVCWNIRLVSLKETDLSGIRAVSRSIKAIKYAKEQGIDILNYSAGTTSTADIVISRNIAIQNYPGLFVCAAGNSTYNTDVTTVYPAAFKASNLISVGASTSDDHRRITSNYGRATVDIFAPGESIFTTKVGGIYQSVSGTSLAAPFVAGVAALMMAENPYLTPEAIKQIIIRTADTVYDENGNNVFENLCVSGGRLNAYAALQACHLHDEDSNIEYEDDWHTVGMCEVCETSDIEQPHHLIPYKYYSTYDHYGVCACGYVQFEGHSHDLYVNSCTSETSHYAYCACGSEKSYYHVYVSATPGSNYNWICRDCGKTNDDTTMPPPQSLVSGAVMMQMNTSGLITLPDGTTLQILTETGSYVLSNGIIVLSPEDAALADAGLLDPYELVENITVPSNPGHVTE